MKIDRVALDIDDVLAGYVIGVHEVFNTKLVPHDHWSPVESTGELILKLGGNQVIGFRQEYLDKCEHNKDFWYGLEAIALPADIPPQAVAYITSSPKNMVDVRIEWLKKHGFPTLPVIHSKDKALTMRRLGIDILIDDRLETVESVQAIGGLGAVHYSPYYSSVKTHESITHLNQYVNQYN